MSKYLDGVGVKYLWTRTKAHVESEISQIKNTFGSVYRFKGSVDDIDALKSIPQDESLLVGDVYNVKSTGMNYVWTGETENYDEGWDALGGLVDIQTLTTDDIDQLLAEE